MHFVYILKCVDGGLYIGYSQSLKQRLIQHGQGRVISTRARRPFRLIYFECYANKEDARAREVFLKSGSGRNQLKKQMKHSL